MEEKPKTSVKGKLKVLRIICFSIALLGVAYRLMDYVGSSFILIGGFSGLAACYFVLAFRNLKISSQKAYAYITIGICLWILLAVLDQSDIRTIVILGLNYTIIVAIIGLVLTRQIKNSTQAS